MLHSVIMAAPCKYNQVLAFVFVTYLALSRVVSLKYDGLADKTSNDVLKGSNDEPQSLSFLSRIGKGFENAYCDEVNILIKDIINDKLPDVSGETHTSVGTLHYNITRLKVRDVGDVACHVTVQLGKLDVKLSNASVKLHGHWAIKIGAIKASGTMDVRSSGISVAVNATLSIGSILHPNKKHHVLSCKANIRHIHIDLHGSTGWFYQSFVDHYADQIKQQIDAMICKKLELF